MLMDEQSASDRVLLQAYLMALGPLGDSIRLILTY